MTISQGMHQFSGGMPVVERTSNRYGAGRRMRELKADRHQLRGDAWGVVVVVIMFHGW